MTQPAPPRRLAMVHTVGSLVPVFDALCAELLPGVVTSSVVDETLLADAIRDGGVTPAIAARLRSRVQAVAAEADLVLVTCSSMGGAVDDLVAETGAAVLRVDEAMADEALRIGVRVGVAATLPTTLRPTTALVERRAREQGRAAVVEPALAEGAFAALRAGDARTHDGLVSAVIDDLAGRTDVVVLAQASMARALEGRPAPRVPVLTSPRLGVARVAERLGVSG